MRVRARGETPPGLGRHTTNRSPRYKYSAVAAQPAAGISWEQTERTYREATASQRPARTGTPTSTYTVSPYLRYTVQFSSRKATVGRSAQPPRQNRHEQHQTLTFPLWLCFHSWRDSLPGAAGLAGAYCTVALDELRDLIVALDPGEVHWSVEALVRVRVRVRVLVSTGVQSAAARWMIPAVSPINHLALCAGWSRTNVL